MPEKKIEEIAKKIGKNYARATSGIRESRIGRSLSCSTSGLPSNIIGEICRMLAIITEMISSIWLVTQQRRSSTTLYTCMSGES